MLPGKKYTPEDFLRIAWRRKWLILLPTLVIWAGSFVWAYSLPDRYRSSATVLVIPQRVPESYVRSTVTATVAERLQTISQQILSRTRLERIIDEFGLYPDERKTMIMEDIVEMMRRNDVKIDVARPTRRSDDASHFSVGFEAANPRTAMRVAERLATMFVQENLQDREVLADSTNQFLQAQLEDSRRRLLEHESKLQTFKQQNAGYLPTQAQSNLQMMQLTQSQMQENTEAANRERDRLATLEIAMNDLITTNAATVATARKNSDATPSAAQQLETARAQFKSLEQRLKPTHPDLIRAKRVMADLERKADEEAVRQTPLGAAEAPANLPSSVAAKLNAMRLETEQLRRSLDTRKAEDERLRGVRAGYASRLEVAPKLEAELTELMRDYQTLEDQYTTLLKKSEDSKIAVNLERRQIGEQFKVIDGARLPERPFSPDRLRLNFIGALSGLGLAIAIVGLLEYRDTTLKTDDDVVTSLALPALAVIPMMISAVDARRLKRRRVLLGVSAASATTLLVIVAVAAWRFNLLRALVG